MPVHLFRLPAVIALAGIFGLSACTERKLETDSSAEPSAIGSAAPTGQPAPVSDLAPTNPPAGQPAPKP